MERPTVAFTAVPEDNLPGRRRFPGYNMKTFLDRDFLLNSDAARELYHEHAAHLPIFDYHSHLSPEAIATDARFENIATAWLARDPAKWRAMRANGVPERFITGDAGWREKFDRWAVIVPAMIGNPVYHWTHLELRRYFGIHRLLSPQTAEEIWNYTNEMLQDPAYSVRGLLNRMDVRYLATTDDPADDLRFHEVLARERRESAGEVRPSEPGRSTGGAHGAADRSATSGTPPFRTVVHPSFRPDRAYDLRDTRAWRDWVGRLARAADMDRIDTFEHLRRALSRRIDAFAALGCRIGDHSLAAPVNTDYTEGLLNGVIAYANRNGVITQEDAAAFTTAVLEHLAREYAARGWVMQLRIGALRGISSRGHAAVGADAGYDAINDEPIARFLAGFLDRLDRDDALPRTILHGRNPADSAQLEAIAGSFQDGSVRGKVQHASAWWFNDHQQGIMQQLTSVAYRGSLGRFVGMTSDARSFLSFPRHEYFRRVLADLIGGWVERGEAPDDMNHLGKLVRDVCWFNAYDLFGVSELPREIGRAG